MPLIHDQHGYHFGRIPGNPLSANQFEAGGKTYEIYDSPSTGKGRYDQVHHFREVGTRIPVYSLSMKALVEKLTGDKI